MSNTTHNSADPTSELSKSNKQSEKQMTSTATRSVKPIAIIALALSLTALGGVGYERWRSIMLEQQLEQQIATTEPLLQKLNSELLLQSNQLSSTKAKLEALQKQTRMLDQRSERLLIDTSALSGKVRALEGSARTDARIVEVEYLLRQANQQMLMASDIKGAKQLLNSADTILQSLDDYDLLTVREALAKDITALNAVPVFDLEGIYSQLQAVSGYIKSLPLLQDKQFTSNDSANKSDAQNTSDNSWKSKVSAIFHDVWQSFASLFRFSAHSDKAFKTLLTSEQEALVRQNLYVLIEQAKLALLARQPAIYKNSLIEANQWLEKYFSPNIDGVDAISQELLRLAAVDVRPKRLTVNLALNALKQYRLKMSQVKPKPKPEPVNKRHSEKLPFGQESHSTFSPPLDVSTSTKSAIEEAQ